MNIQRTFLYFAMILVSACSTISNKNLAADKQTLQPCPDRPNCVSSLATDEHAIAPLTVTSKGLNHLYQVISQQDGCSTITLKGNYLHAECASNLFGFIDDLEFVQADNIIHLRSAARLGYSDLGVNRKRIEAIRSKLDSAL